jgi:hypothetical protein
MILVDSIATNAIKDVMKEWNQSFQLFMIHKFIYKIRIYS